jgi:cobalamin biosynthetic protein CobC
MASADPLFFHGGRIAAAARRWPNSPRPWLDLSTGINPHAWDASGIVADARALPMPEALADLEAGAATAFAAPDLPIAALPGTEIGLRLLDTLALPRPWWVVVPSYRTHLDALPGAERLRAVPDEWTGTLLLANPNNPDGRIASDLLARARVGGGWLVVDEAFADVVPDASVLPHLHPDDRVLVLRSFGKFFGLAGVRLGFAAGAAEMVERVRARLGSWPVSAAAIAIGSAAYRDLGWQAAMRPRLVDDAAALDGVLRRHGLDPVGACPLFRMTGADAGLLDRLGRAGILVRPFADDPARFRLGLPGSAAALARLDRALAGG